MARSLLRLALAAAVGLAGLEGALRVAAWHHEGLRRLAFDPNDPVDFYDAETLEELLERTLLGYRPHTEFAGFVLNSRSLRTPEYRHEKAPGVYRVVILGDSFGFVSGGIPQSRHWPAKLEAMLRKKRADGVEVINLSYPAVGPRFCLRMLELEGARLEPDLVLFGLFTGNDLTEEQGRRALGRSLPGLKEWLADRSVLFRAARNAWRIRHGVQIGGFNRREARIFAGGGYEVEGYARAFDDSVPTFAKNAYHRLQSELMGILHEDERERFDRLLEDAVSTTLRMRAVAESTGARFVVALFPPEFVVDRDLAARVARYAGQDLSDYDLDRAHRLLARRFGEEGVECLDLLPVLRERAIDGPLYRPRDTHWNQAGSDAVAVALAARLGDDP